MKKIIFLIVMFVLVKGALGDAPFCPPEFQWILEQQKVAEVTCSSYKYKEHPCELRVQFTDRKNVVFLVVYSKDKSKVIWISVNELLIGEGKILYEKDKEL